MPQQVIDRVHALARKGREINCLEFLNRNKQPYPEDIGDQIAGVGMDDDSSTSSSNSSYPSNDKSSRDDDLSKISREEEE